MRRPARLPFFHNEKMKLKIIAHANSKTPRIKIDLTGTLHMYVKEAPQKGEANRAIIKALAKRFKTTPQNIKIIHGHTSKLKLIEIAE